jgi:hypothetical protein
MAHSTPAVLTPVEFDNEDTLVDSKTMSMDPTTAAATAATAAGAAAAPAATAAGAAPAATAAGAAAAALTTAVATTTTVADDLILAKVLVTAMRRSATTLIIPLWYLHADAASFKISNTHGIVLKEILEWFDFMRKQMTLNPHQHLKIGTFCTQNGNEIILPVALFCHQYRFVAAVVPSGTDDDVAHLHKTDDDLDHTGKAPSAVTDDDLDHTNKAPSAVTDDDLDHGEAPRAVTDDGKAASAVTAHQTSSNPWSSSALSTTTATAITAAGQAAACASLPQETQHWLGRWKEGFRGPPHPISISGHFVLPGHPHGVTQTITVGTDGLIQNTAAVVDK